MLRDIDKNAQTVADYSANQDDNIEDIRVKGDSYHYVSTYNFDLDEVDAVDSSEPPSGFFKEAWKSLRKNPLFIISGSMILFLGFVTFFPNVLTSADPKYSNLQNSYAPPSPGHPFGYDQQGFDIFSRVVHGTRASLTVGLFTTILVVIIGGAIGAFSAYYGGWIDAILARITDIFFAIPMLLGAIVMLSMLKKNLVIFGMEIDLSKSVWKVVMVLAVFGWTQIARIARGAVLEAKNQEYITASTALGSSKFRNLMKHVLPNSIAPIIVTATVSLGTFIVSEATLSFLGLGLPSSIVSWGGDISVAQNEWQNEPMILFYPSFALALTVLAFILMGDAVRDALDSKARD